MTAATTMTISISDESAEKLERIARVMRRDRVSLAADVLTAYVDREIRIFEAVQQGLADVDAGRTIPHDEVMDQIDAMIGLKDSSSR
ncbi:MULTISPECIES: CopG family ribbon-helix-helix protein [Sphingobium]|uniref:CopG family ribbon-helix-helix protein n=1 Tax=Sphingobium TaxID=165695 RepID=UPI00159C65A6|nr:CopG family transcriptional regulator [Sphingobium sp. 15-1]